MMPKKSRKYSRALLIHPPTGLYVREDRCQAFLGEGMVASTMRPPMEIAYIASILEGEGIRCRIRDYPVEGRDAKALRDDLIKFSPDLFLVSCTSPSLDKDLAVCEIAKNVGTEITTIARGAHFLDFDEEPLQKHSYVDFLIRGEPEYTMLELACGRPLESIHGLSYRRDGEFHRTPNRDFIKNLDELPFPARHLVRNELYTRADTGQPQATIQTSRGCPYHCIFCLTNTVSGSTIRLRSPDNIVEEIRECIEKYQIKNFFFRSDTFTVEKEWTLAVCKAILNAELTIQWVCNSRVDTLDADRLKWMKASGCWGISLGIESGSPEILDRIHKGTTLDHAREAVRLCKSFDVLSYAYFVLGLPWETEETLKQTFRFSRELDTDLVEYYFAYPYPCTPLYQIVTRHGLIKDLPLRSQSAPAFSPFSLDQKKMETLRKRALIHFHLRPRFIVRTLRRTKSPREFMNYISFAYRAYRKNRRIRGTVHE